MLKMKKNDEFVFHYDDLVVRSLNNIINGYIENGVNSIDIVGNDFDFQFKLNYNEKGYQVLQFIRKEKNE